MSLDQQQTEDTQASTPSASTPAPVVPIHEDEASLEAIARFDELEEDRLAELVSNPAAKQILERLREVDRWLESAVSGNDATEVSADELYRFGRGRGAEPLSDLRHREVAAFLEEHPEEARWTEKLSEPIPAPLDVTPPRSFPPVHLPRPQGSTPSIQPVEELPGPSASVTKGPTHRAVGAHASGQGRRAPRRIAPWMAWIPVAAAALVITMVLDPSGTTNAMEGGLPESPVLRSASSTPLLFPRGRVLAPVDGLETYSTRPLFEVAAVEGAERYRFQLRLNAGGAFDAGDTVWEAESTSRSATADRLQAGAYEWSAWAAVNGVERSLGTLSFVVMAADDAALIQCASGADAEPGSTREDVRRLHSAGYLADARFRARDLAPGEDRAAYLAEDR